MQQECKPNSSIPDARIPYSHEAYLETGSIDTRIDSWSHISNPVLSPEIHHTTFAFDDRPSFFIIRSVDHTRRNHHSL